MLINFNLQFRMFRARKNDKNKQSHNFICSGALRGEGASGPGQIDI